MDYTVQLDAESDQSQDEEAFVVTFADGRSERMRVHDYDRVYAIPGLYEEIVQRRLQCQSPTKVADIIVRAAQLGERDVRSLRVLDVGAGNGVVGELLRDRGVELQVGADIAAARDAAERDRPGLYAEYLIGDLADHPRVPGAIDEHRLNALVAVGALGMGHISAESFDAAWRRFPSGAWLAVTLPEELVDPGTSDFGDSLAAEMSAGRLEVVERERYRHRLLMDGSEVFYVAIVGRGAV